MSMVSALVLALAVVPIALGFAAQLWVRASFARARAVPAEAGLTGAEAAPRLLAATGVAGVSVELLEETLADHYDPRDRTIRISADVAGSTSVGALAIVAHEAGHAAQDAEGDGVFRLQRTIVPAASLCSYGWLVAIGAGFLLESAGLVAVALVLFAGVAAFHVATLPVELDASRRALGLLGAEGLLQEEELPVARGVLRAAAATYLVAALVAIAGLARIALELFLALGDED